AEKVSAFRICSTATVSLCSDHVNAVSVPTLGAHTIWPNDNRKRPRRRTADLIKASIIVVRSPETKGAGKRLPAVHRNVDSRDQRSNSSCRRDNRSYGNDLHDRVRRAKDYPPVIMGSAGGRHRSH